MIHANPYLLSSGASIRRLLQSGEASRLEEALCHQKSFWRFVVVMALVMIARMYWPLSASWSARPQVASNLARGVGQPRDLACAF